MKRSYNAPSIEKVEFRYQEQIAAASGIYCQTFQYAIPGCSTSPVGDPSSLIAN